MTPEEIEKFRKRVMWHAKVRNVGFMAEDIASEAVRLALELPFGGAGKSTRWLALIAIQSEMGTRRSHKRRVFCGPYQWDEDGTESWEDDGEERRPAYNPPSVIPDPSLWVDFKTKFKSLPNWKQVAFNRAQSYGGAIPQGSLRRASSAVLKDLRGFLAKEYEMEYEHGRAGARKRELEKEMRGGRGKWMRSRHKPKT